MTTITIEHDVPVEKFAQIEFLLRSEEIKNAEFNGEDFKIDRGEFTSIDNDEYSYVLLLKKINDIISGYGDGYQ